ncbi:DNA polymerase Y family protein [Pleomorphomonas sp. NRK KF1]|uniref:Y-family DNA polymerase n=1 Tax=Pleomorphomonas sp. NRK KF1 TaxID=2943000 RepID=UPI003530ED8A
MVAWLPHLATDRLARLDRERSSPSAAAEASARPPMVLTAKHRSAVRLAHVDGQAVRLGLQPGLGLADARARVPGLDVRAADPEADAAFLDRLCDWAQRYTPLAGRRIGTSSVDPEFPYPEDFTLVLDIAGCAHLFGGEEALAADMARRLERQDLTVSIGIASTIGAAHALAAFGRGGRLQAGEERRALAGLPMAALRLDATTVDALARVGLKRIGDLMDGPRAPLTARFGRAPLIQLDRALGLADEAFSPRLPVAPYCAERRFFEPIAREEDVRAVALSLIGALAERLEAAGEGALHLRLSLWRVDGALAHVEAGLSRPSREATVMQDILCRRLDSLAEDFDAGYGFDCVTVAVTEASRRDAEVLSLAGPDTALELTRFVDRVGARIGRGRVRRLKFYASHIPERASRAVPAHVAEEASFPATDVLAGDPPERPIRLFAQPELVEAMASVPDGPPLRFRWRRVTHEVKRAEGPERIAGEWWRQEAPTRDYFRVEDAEGRRFWMFREGLFQVETNHPRWFVHGLFA